MVIIKLFNLKFMSIVFLCEFTFVFIEPKYVKELYEMKVKVFYSVNINYSKLQYNLER